MMDTEWQIHLIKDRWTVIEEKHFPGKEEKGITPIRAAKMKVELSFLQKKEGNARIAI